MRGGVRQSLVVSVGSERCAVHDISVPIRDGMVVYPRNPSVSVQRVRSIADGGTANVTRLDLGAHTGTHVDAPVHFFDGGDGVEALSLDALIGPAQVVEVSDGDVRPRDVPSSDAEATRVLFKTRNSDLWRHDSFAPDFARVSEEAAEALVAASVRLVGLDYLSVGGAGTHRTLLSAGVVILEGLDLSGVRPGVYELICLPLNVAGSDGAPARAILLGTSAGESDGRK